MPVPFSGLFPGAQQMAEAYLEFAQGRFATNEIRFEQNRDIDFSSPLMEPNEVKQAAVIKNYIKQILRMPRTLKIQPFARITEGTPYLLSILGLIVFFFSLSVTIPESTPVLGSIVGGETFGPQEVAWLFPFVLIGATLFLQIRARILGLKYSATRDYILGLVLNHGWRRERFAGLFTDIIDAEGLGWLRKVGEWMWSWDPDTFRQVRADAARKQGKEVATERPGTEFTTTIKRLAEEDFEARIHALYYVEKEHDFRSWNLALDPFLFLLPNRRAVRRAQAIQMDGLGGLLYLGMCSLPGGDDHRIRRKFLPLLIGWPVLTLGIPLIWSFFLKPWPTVFGWVGMVFLMAGTLAPMIVWNYKLLIQCRGLPRGVSWTDIQGDLKFLRGL